MAEIVGYVGESPEGQTRIYRVDDPSQFVDVDRGDLVGAAKTDTHLALAITLREGAATVEGALDRAAFESLFDTAAEAKPYQTFYCDSKFWKCEHSIHIC